MRIAVCEDFSPEREAVCAYISQYCQQHSYQVQISAFDTGEVLLGAFSPGAFDLIFLDIYLPGISGIEAARKIRESDKDCLLVFITTSEDFALEGFRVFASGYVVKPISPEKMDNVLHTCRHLFERNSRAIGIPGSVGTISISIADLIYVEVYGKESVFHMKRGKLASRIPLDSVESLLGGVPFLRCHRCYIINMNYVEDILPNDFLMRNGNTVPIRVNGKKKVLMEIARFMANPL
jgi:DNA-binding LytR/AlgR family response regulator